MYGGISLDAERGSGTSSRRSEGMRRRLDHLRMIGRRSARVFRRGLCRGLLGVSVSAFWLDSPLVLLLGGGSGRALLGDCGDCDAVLVAVGGAALVLVPNPRALDEPDP